MTVIARVPPSVGRFAVTDDVYDCFGTGGPVTLVAGMFSGSTVDISTRYSSVVYGRRPSSHFSEVVPLGWLTHALPHAVATLSASSAGGAEVGFGVGEGSRVGRSLVAPPVVSPVVVPSSLVPVSSGAALELPVVSAAAPDPRPPPGPARCG